MKAPLIIMTGVLLGVAALTGAAVNLEPKPAAAVTATPQAARPGNAEPQRFALPDSKASKAPGTITVSPGLHVLSTKGDEIGTVESMISNEAGRVISFRVNMGDRSAMVPARLFTQTGKDLTSAMDEAAIRKVIEQTFEEEPNPFPEPPQEL